MARSLIANTVIASGGRLLTVGLSVLVTALIARLLGVEAFGRYSALLAYGAIVQLAADWGLYLTLTRTIAERPKQQQEILSQVMSLRLLLLSIAFVSGWLGLLLIPSLRNLGVAYGVLAVGLSLQSLSQLYMGIFQYHQSVWGASFGDIMGRLVQLVGIGIIMILGITLPRVVGVLTMSLATAYLVHQWIAPSGAWRLVLSWEAWRVLVRTSAPLGIMLVLNAIYFRADLVMVAQLRSSAEAGWYGAAFRIIESGLFFPAMFGGLLLPRLSEALKKQLINQARQLLEEALRITVLASVFCLVVISLRSREIINLIVGAEYTGAAPLLQILGIALASMFFGNLFGFTMVALRRQRALLKLYAVLVVVNIGANSLAIPQYGAVGAAWTTVATELIATSVAGIIVYRALLPRLNPTFILQVIGLTIGTVFAVSSLPKEMPIVLQISVAGLVFSFLAYLAGSLSVKQYPLLMKKP